MLRDVELGVKWTERTNILTFFVFVGVALASFAWRFASIPWDAGGFFYQVWVATLGLGFLIRYFPELSENGRLPAWLISVLGTLIMFGTLYFAPQALFPFMFVAFVSVASLRLWWKSKKAPAILVAILLIPLSTYCLYGLRHIVQLTRLRTLESVEVSELHFTAMSSEREVIVVSNRNAIETIVPAFNNTTPYSPNHETVEQPWRLTIIMQNGALLEVDIGSGNRAHPTFVWVEFGVEVYQNSQLREALQAVGLDLWDSSS